MVIQNNLIHSNIVEQGSGAVYVCNNTLVLNNRIINNTICNNINTDWMYDYMGNGISLTGIQGYATGMWT